MAPVEPGGVSGGELGGLVAGVIALLIAIGHGSRWLLGWSDNRARTRHEKLNTWQTELEHREKTLDNAVSARLLLLEKQVPQLIHLQAKMRTMVDRWRIAFKIVAAELVTIAPHSMALMQAQSILADAETWEPVVPDDMGEMLDEMDGTGSGLT